MWAARPNWWFASRRAPRLGPVAGWWGAHRLSLVLVGIYLAACLLGVGWGFYVFVVRPFKFYQFVLFVISLWILQVVLKFWRYLSAVDPARARILASPRRRHAAVNSNRSGASRAGPATNIKITPWAASCPS